MGSGDTACAHRHQRSNIQTTSQAVCYPLMATLAAFTAQKSAAHANGSMPYIGNWSSGTMCDDHGNPGRSSSSTGQSSGGAGPPLAADVYLLFHICRWTTNANVAIANDPVEQPVCLVRQAGDNNKTKVRSLPRIISNATSRFTGEGCTVKTRKG